MFDGVHAPVIWRPRAEKKNPLFGHGWSITCNQWHVIMSIFSLQTES
jgi:hypothetical protein